MKRMAVRWSAGMGSRCHVVPPSAVFASPRPVPVQPAMYPTFGFRRWIADSDRAVPSFGVGVGGIVDGGEAETVELGDGFTSACGEQAALKTAGTSRASRA